MKIALVGAHGTGKTEVLKRLQTKRPDYTYFTNIVRNLSESYGYNNIYEIENKFGAIVSEPLCMSHLSIINPDINPLVKDKDFVIDRSPVDYYAYYLAERKTKQDFKIEELMKNIGVYYGSIIDLFVHFPTGVFPLNGDKHRPKNVNYQLKVGNLIKESFQILGLEDKKYNLQQRTIEKRIEEISKLM